MRSHSDDLVVHHFSWWLTKRLKDRFEIVLQKLEEIFWLGNTFLLESVQCYFWNRHMGTCYPEIFGGSVVEGTGADGRHGEML